MKPFDYISVVLSIVVGLAMTQALTGIANLIRSGVRRWSIPALYWIGYSLFLCIDFWFSIWGLHEQVGWSFGFVLFLLGHAAIIYLVTHMTVPDAVSSKSIDLVASFEGNRRRLMSLFLVLGAIGGTTNLMLPGFGSMLLLLLVGGLMLLWLAAFIWKSERVQIGVAAGNLVLTSIYLWHFMPTL